MTPEQKKRANRLLSLCLYGSITCIGFGIALWSIPAALIYLGMVLFALGVGAFMLLKSSEAKDKLNK